MDPTFEELLKLIALNIRSFGFERKGSVFRKIEGDFSSVIEFQKSVDSDSGGTRFTVTLGIVSKLLLDDGEALGKAKCIDAHLTERLGGLMAAGGDRWWVLSGKDNFADLSSELTHALVSIGIPYLEKYASKPALKDLWESGVSPGLTKVQADRLLKRLSA